MVVYGDVLWFFGVKYGWCGALVWLFFKLQWVEIYVNGANLVFCGFVQSCFIAFVQMFIMVYFGFVLLFVNVFGVFFIVL